MGSISRSPSYLIVHRNAFYFRRRVPDAVASRLGRREVRYSLRFARDLHSARIAAMRLAVVADKVFTCLSGGCMAELTQDQIKRLTDLWFRQALEAEEEKRLPPNRWNEEKLEEYLETFGLLLSDEREALGLSDYSRAHSRADRLLEEEGIAAPKDSLEYQALCRELLKAGVRVGEIDLRRAVGDYSDEWAAQGQPPPPPPPSISLQEALDEYVDRKGRLGQWSTATTSEAVPKLGKFVDHLGPNTPINFITPDQMRTYADEVTKLPGRATGSRIGPAGIDGHYSKVREFLNWADNKSYGVPERLVGIIKLEGKIKKAKLRPFTPDDLDAIFATKWYAQDKITKPSKFWVPLMSLYSGARLEELSQLRVEDINKVDGVWCFAISDEGEGQSTKTAAACRIVPIHPFLIGLGLLTYVRQRGKRGQLWPELKQSAKGTYGHSVGTWFGRLKRELGFGQEKNFHSFRRTFINRCKQTSVDTAKIKEIVGHELSDLTLGDYPDRYDPSVLYEDVIGPIDYGVDLSHLKQSRWVA